MKREGKKRRSEKRKGMIKISGKNTRFRSDFQFSQFAVVNVHKYEHRNTGNSKKVLHMGNSKHTNSPG